MQNKTLIWRQSTLIRSVEFVIPSNHLASGCRFRARNQMPVLAGLGCSVRDIVGSVRHLRVDRGKLTGSLRWCDDSEAAISREKFNSGVLRLNLETVEFAICALKRGEELFGLRGPMNAVYEWQPVFVRLVANNGGFP